MASVARGRRGSSGMLPYPRKLSNGKIVWVNPHKVQIKKATALTTLGKPVEKQLFYSIPYEQRTVSVYDRKGIKQGRGLVKGGRVVVRVAR